MVLRYAVVVEVLHWQGTGLVLQIRVAVWISAEHLRVVFVIL